jgi:hypothetical protein
MKRYQINNVFHVSLVKKYVLGRNHINDWIVIQVENEGDFWVEPIHILDWKLKVPRKKSIGMVKVQWKFYDHEYETWEHEETMWEEYSQIFSNFEENRS